MLKEIKKIIEEYQHSLQQHLPAVELEVNSIIHDKVQNNNTIEGVLDTLLSMTDMGVGKDLFIKLLNYYKTIDAEGAAFYWNEFDKDEA